MKIHRYLFCSVAICIVLLSLEGFAVSQQKRKRTSRGKPTTTSSTSAAATSSKNLTRPRAVELIKTHPAFRTTTNSDIPVGTFWYDWRDIKQLVENNIQPLVDAGIVTFRETGRSNSVWFHEYVVEITPEGQAEARGWIKGTEREWVLQYQGPTGILSPDVTLYHIPVAERQLIEVTGIASEPNGTRARVEFTWKWVATSHGKYLPNKVPSGEAHGGAVEFQLYDDGWRMGQMYIGFPYFS